MRSTTVPRLMVQKSKRQSRGSIRPMDAIINCRTQPRTMRRALRLAMCSGTIACGRLRAMPNMSTPWKTRCTTRFWLASVWMANDSSTPTRSGNWMKCLPSFDGLGSVRIGSVVIAARRTLHEPLRKLDALLTRSTRKRLSFCFMVLTSWTLRSAIISG